MIYSVLSQLYDVVPVGLRLNKLIFTYKRLYDYTASGKKETKMFFVISSIKLRRVCWNLVQFCWIDLPQNYINVFNFARKMSLHYLVKL